MTGVNMHARCMQVEAFWYGTSALMMQVLSINNDVGPFKTMSGHIFRPIFYPSGIPETPVDLTKAYFLAVEKAKAVACSRCPLRRALIWQYVCTKVVHLFSSYGPSNASKRCYEIAASVFLKSSPFKSRTTSMIISSKFNYES